MKNKVSVLKEYMPAKDRSSMGKLPTTHENCMEKTGVSRPGKTARDRAKNSRARSE
jgi:hypothetical protein